MAITYVITEVIINILSLISYSSFAAFIIYYSLIKNVIH